jgi:fatty-acid desaturase
VVKQRHRTTTRTTATDQQAPTQQTTKVNHGQGITEKQVPIKSRNKNQKFPNKAKLQKNQKITNRIFFFPPLSTSLSTSFHLFPPLSTYVSGVFRFSQTDHLNACVAGFPHGVLARSVIEGQATP